VDERRRFRLLWKTLDRRRRWEVGKLAFLGQEAPDSESAWLALRLIRETPWGRMGLWVQLLIVAGGFATGVVLWILLVPRGGGWFQVFVALLMLAGSVWLLVQTFTFRRAVRLNRPIARLPAG
jgi:hypothetical protein